MDGDTVNGLFWYWRKLKNLMILSQDLPFYISGSMDIREKCHTESKEMCVVSLWSDLSYNIKKEEKEYDFSNCGNWVLMVLKYLKCLHELCVTPAAAAATSDRIDKCAKTVGQGTLTNLTNLLLLEHRITCTISFKLIALVMEIFAIFLALRRFMRHP